MIGVELHVDLGPLTEGFNEIQRKQLPFATALAMTRLAEGVKDDERDEIARMFDTPTPFTLNAIAMRSATKSNLTSVVFVKDIQAEYLEPYVVGGTHYLGAKQGLLTPKGIDTNQYGNLPKGKLAALKGKPGVFVGAVQTKSGERIGGVWQRMGVPGKATATKRGAKPASLPPRGALKLLIRFSDPQQVKVRLDFYGVAQRHVERYAGQEFERAWAAAMATAR